MTSHLIMMELFLPYELRKLRGYRYTSRHIHEFAPASRASPIWNFFFFACEGKLICQQLGREVMGWKFQET